MRDYTTRRNDAFMRECRRQRRLLSEEKGSINTDEMIARAAKAPAPSYYVSYGYALRWVGRQLRNESALDEFRSNRRALLLELAAKCKAIMAVHPNLDPGQALTRVLTSEGASSYFLTFRSARSLYFELAKTKHTRTHHLRRRKLL